MAVAISTKGKANVKILKMPLAIQLKSIMTPINTASRTNGLVLFKVYDLYADMIIGLFFYKITNSYIKKCQEID